MHFSVSVSQRLKSFFVQTLADLSIVAITEQRDTRYQDTLERCVTLITESRRVPLPMASKFSSIAFIRPLVLASGKTSAVNIW